MARIRRKLAITGDEYNFGGGASSSSSSSSAGGFVKIAKGHPVKTNANHDGYLTSGDTVTIAIDANTAIATKDQYIYFDNAFDTSTVTVTYEFLNGVTALPAGVAWNTNTDTQGSDTGEARFSGTPTASATTSFKIKIDYPSGNEAADITYVLKVFPTGTTPVWASSDLPDRIIQNLAGDQVLVAGPTTTYSGATYTLSNVSGFPTGITPVIDSATGQVVVTDVGAILQAASAHSLTVTADLGEYGTLSQTLTGNVAYGDAYGASYFGPGNSKGNPAGYQTTYNGAYMSDGQYAALWNTNVNAGALRCRTNSSYSTSPYKFNENIGLTYTEGYAYSSGTTGYLGPKTSSNLNTNSNGAVLRLKWVVPTGVTQFSVVCVGAGSMGAYTWANHGGGGAGMAWLNDVLCTSGEEFDVAVGLPRRSVSSNSSYWSGSTWIRRIVARDYGANELLCVGYGGGYQTGHSAPLNGRTNPDTANMLHVESYNHNNSRDPGSAAVSTRYGTKGYNRGGIASGNYAGGGAAGYEGIGGNSNNLNGAGGGAGAGQYHSSTYGNSAGGGVGLDGRGAGGIDGAGSGRGGAVGAYSANYEADGTNAYRYGGGGGSGGSRGCYGENPQTSNTGVQNQYINGGMHGGGGGGSGTSWGGGAGGMGGIRIIWGTGRSFPKTYTTEDATISDSTNPGDGR